MINVKRTAAELRRWPGIVDGYLNLTLFTCFFILYVYILLDQQEIPNSHKIDFMVRSALLDEDGALSKVNTEGLFPHARSDPKKYCTSNTPRRGSIALKIQRIAAACLRVLHRLLREALRSMRSRGRQNTHFDTGCRAGRAARARARACITVRAQALEEVGIRVFPSRPDDSDLTRRLRFDQAIQI